MATGEAGLATVGAKSGVARSCWRRSGEALRRNQFSGSGETAIWACVRGCDFRLPARKTLQFRQLQFHWGKPPPAAEPRTFTRMLTRLPMAAQGGLRD